MNISITVDDKAVRKLLAEFPKAAGRAAEIALDKTAFEIRDEIKNTMRRVFDAPVPYTLNSLRVTKTQNHNMVASVWFKDPDRMGQHYLVPQVEGGQRKLKGFERALARSRYVPGRGARRTRHGNISVGQIRQVLSVLGRAELSAGYSANITSRSRRRNTKPREYVYLPRGSGKLPPGVYQRVKSAGARGIGTKTAKARRAAGLTNEAQRSTRGAIIRARGLLPILIMGRQSRATRPLLPFYEVAEQVYADKFVTLFRAELARRWGND